MPLEVGAEYHPFVVRCDMHVRLQTVVVVLHIHQLCGLQSVAIVVEAENPLVLVVVSHGCGASAITY